MIKSHSCFVLFFAVVFLFVSCGGGEEEEDTISPVVTITSAATVSQMPYHLRGTATDDTAVTSLSYSIDSGAVVPIQPIQSPFSSELNLTEGIYQVAVTASDAAGNSSSAEITLTYTQGANLPVTTTEGLINHALENGEINQETALLYKVYALFGDSRLPEIYRGQGGGASFENALNEIGLLYSSLSEETKSLVGPFLVPPYYKGSWWSIKKNASVQSKVNNVTKADEPPCIPTDDCDVNTEQWLSLLAANNRIRVWYPSDDENLVFYAPIIVGDLNTTIVPALDVFFGDKTPVPDGNKTNHGLGPELDLALIDFRDPDLKPVEELGENEIGFVRSYDNCENDAVYIVVNSNATYERLLYSVVHELTHAYQWSYTTKDGCIMGSYRWISDAIATWAFDYVYESLTFEQHWAVDHFFPAPEKSLDYVDGAHEYSAYLFPFYLSRKHSVLEEQAYQWVKSIWDSVGSAGHLEVLENGIGLISGSTTSLEKEWAQFVIANWNRDEIKYYKDWDDLQAGVKTIKDLPLNDQGNTEVSLNGQTEGKIEIPVRLPHLSAQYASFEFTDPDVSSVVFYNGITHMMNLQQVEFPPASQAYVAEPLSEEDKRGGQVWAITKINGSWNQPENWTDDPFRVFCRDSTAGRIEELVLIFSNADIQDQQRYIEPKGENATLAFSNIGCWQWQGGAHFVDDNDGVKVQLDVTAQWDVMTPMIGPVGATGKALVGISYNMTSGTLLWEITGTDSQGCVHSGSIEETLAEFSPVPNMPTSNVYQNYNYVTDGDAYRGFLLSGFIKNYQPITVAVTEDCPDDPPITNDVEIYPMLSILPENPHGKVDNTGKTISGDGSDAKGGTSVTGSWSFSAQKEVSPP